MLSTQALESFAYQTQKSCHAFACEHVLNLECAFTHGPVLTAAGVYVNRNDS